MKRTLSTIAVAAVLVGSGLTGCGGTSGATPASSSEVTAAVRASTHEYEPNAPMDDGHESERNTAVSSFMTLLNNLAKEPALAPLFDEYGVQAPIVIGDDNTSAGLIQLLRAVRITVVSGQVTLTNRATGEVFYSAPLSDLGSGTLDPGGLPTTGTPPPAPPPGATCTAFTYSAWGACQPDGTQTRTVATSSPSGCTGGTPVTTQACTYVPPVTTCTSFTYSAWGACQSNGTQTRTVATSAPTGCTGGTPVTSQSCTYTAPNPVTSANIVASCTGCHGLTSNTTVFKAGGYSKTGASSATWLNSVNSMIKNDGATLAPGTTAQNYADALSAAP